MKKLLPGLAALVLFLSSCGLFDSKKESALPTGRWRLDSIQTGRDSNLVYAVMASNLEESPIAFEFRKDTLLTSSDGGTDTSGFQFDEARGVLQMEKDPNPYTYRRMNDSMVLLTASDSTVFYLKKWD